ncbi:MAG TPA: pyruvate formate lyase family protein, partial [Gammaproteobacteria bacterium]|nr:pyruvate formate lyase family protein [Gammaproteobacteria bacterium]
MAVTARRAAKTAAPKTKAAKLAAPKRQAAKQKAPNEKAPKQRTDQPSSGGSPAWAGFHRGLWQSEINVRDFIQTNYTPYDGDESFLAGATARTKKIWKKLTDLFVEERKKGVLDVSQIPSSITAHAPGYIDKGNEVIVGLQTEAPLKRAIMPNGGFRL